jgi:hypothetical protein
MSQADRDLDVLSGFADHRPHGNHVSNPDHLKRLIAAYRKSKADQETASATFRIRGIWAEWIAVHYGPVIKAIELGDVERLGLLLENTYRESFSSGTGGYDNLLRLRRPLGQLYIRHLWTTYRKTLEQSGYDMARLRFPMVGNPAGVMLNGSVISVETLRHAYNARLIHQVLRDVPKPVIVEIGGGLGGQCFQAMNLGRIAQYTNYDIPEVAVVSGYFLLSAFPNKGVRLYGESGPAEIAVMPHFSITSLEARSVDLFYNSSSFSEMDGACALAYLEIIEYAGRRYFLHDNHETRLTFSYGDGTRSVSRIGSEMVPRGFRLLSKKPRAHRMPEDHGFEHYEYLYER